MKLANARHGDAAEMCYIEYVDREGELRPAMPVVTPQIQALMDQEAMLALQQAVGDDEAARVAGGGAARPPQ